MRSLSSRFSACARLGPSRTEALEDRIDVLRETQARSVDIAVADRRQIERDLHDGAQQRLLAVALAIRLAGSRAAGGSRAEVADLVAEAAAELDAAVTELRELASGVYPAELAGAGLAAALPAMVVRSPVPARITAVPAERLPPAVERACWFTVGELLSNAAKHAAAGHVEIDLRVEEGHVVLRVVDDGVGGADADGSGLRGLADRAASAGGRLTVHSPPGAGTRVEAVFPAS